MVLVSLATVERRRGRYPKALALVEESLALGRDLAYEEVSLYCLLELAALLAVHDDADAAGRVLGASEAVLEKLAVVLPAPDEETRTDTLAAVLAALGEEACAEALASGRRTSLDEAIDGGLRDARDALAPAS
jgi:hypothetical protein